MPTTILVVDDTPTNLKVLATLLNDLGWRVLVASDGVSAMEQVELVPPDLILLDVMMPEIDGFETCRRLKANPATLEIPIIFMTALNEVADKVRGFALGAADYITKPFQREEVVARIQTHLALSRQKKELQQEISDRRKAEFALRLFVHAISHDLRNPVTGMLLILQSLAKSEPIIISPEVFAKMLHSSQLQLDLINSLLESHANQVYGVHLQREVSDLGAIAQSAIADLEPMLNAEQAIITNHIPADLPPLWVDPLQIRRVLINLITNALKHNPPQLAIALSADLDAEQANMVRCVVRDRGVGMTPEQAECLFEPYHQGQRRHLSLGLGLYICRQIIHAHGGEIGVISQPRQGATFWFTLPRAHNQPS